MAFVGDILSGKTLARARFNSLLRRQAPMVKGRVLDLASGSGSYHPFFTGVELVCGDVRDSSLDFNKALPYPNASFDHVLLFNAMYIAEHPEGLMREIRRVVKQGGRVLVASPFLQNEMREPHDYVRFTSEGLERLFTASGFRATLVPYGERFSVGANLLHAFLLLSIIRLPVYALATLLDILIPKRVRTNHPAPLGYFCILIPA